jgi:hypothetical protein
MASPGKQLICPECGQLMAAASWGLFRGLRITAPAGFLVTPVSNDLMLRSTEQRLASASAADPEAQRRRAFVLSHPGDRFYDIKCPTVITCSGRRPRYPVRSAGPQVIR